MPELHNVKSVGVWLSASELATLNRARGSLKLATYIRDAALKVASQTANTFPIDTGYDIANYEGEKYEQDPYADLG